MNGAIGSNWIWGIRQIAFQKSMKERFESRIQVAQKMGCFGFLCFAVTISLVTGQWIRELVIFLVELMLRGWIGYLKLLSC